MRQDHKTNVPRKWDPHSSCRGVVVIGERMSIISGSGGSLMNNKLIVQELEQTSEVASNANIHDDALS